jgi:hypothetical protein
LNTFLIGLLDGDVDVGEVDAILPSFKQPNSMPMTDEQHFLFLDRDRSQRKRFTKTPVSHALFIDTFVFWSKLPRRHS